MRLGTHKTTAIIVIDIMTGNFLEKIDEKMFFTVFVNEVVASIN